MREVERKYVADAPVAPTFEPLSVSGPPRTFTLTATYLDTPTHALADAGWSVRRRGGGHDAGWFLKRPADRDVRLERHLPDGPTLPPELRAIVTGAFGQVPLIPVALLVTQRTEQTLAAASEPVAMAASDHVTATVGNRTVAWWELEVELAAGGDASVFVALEPGLNAAGLRRSPWGSKVGRALAESVAFVPPTDPDAPAWAVLLTALSRHVGVLQALAAPVLSDAPDAVHKSRVAMRRLRSLLRAYGPLFEPELTGPLARELKWWGEVLGAPRDAEVLRQEFGELLAELGPEALDGTVARRLLRHLDASHAAAHATLVEEASTHRYAALTESLVRLLVDPPWAPGADAPAGDLLPPRVSDAVARVARLRAKAERQPQRLDRWHDVRKGAKAVRYALEALTSAFDDIKPHVRAWTAVTEAFGTFQDAVVARELIEQVAAEAAAAGEPTHPFGVLAEIQDDRRDIALATGRAALTDAEAAWSAR